VFLLADEVRRLRTMVKPVDFDWMALLLAKCASPNTRYRVKVHDLGTGRIRGALHVYARRGSVAGDYSTGLVYFDLANDPLPVVRLNGPHPNAHVNRLPVRLRLPVAPHVHYLTERYQKEGTVRRKLDPDGYALCTTAYDDLAGALGALARRTKLVTVPTPLPFGAMRRLP
jgi:hypothetical protein